MTPEQITALFTRDDGSFLCARWGRPVAPVIFGLADDSLDIFRAAIRSGFAAMPHPVTDTDPEMGANLILFFVRHWSELEGVPDLDALTGIPAISTRLCDMDVDQYRLFRFDGDGGIRACIHFLRMGGALGESHPAQLAESLVMRSALSFAGPTMPGPELARLIRAAYDPVLPIATADPSHALRLAARYAAA